MIMFNLMVATIDVDKNKVVHVKIVYDFFICEMVWLYVRIRK